MCLGSRWQMRGWALDRVQALSSSGKRKKGRLIRAATELSGHREVRQARGFPCLCLRWHLASYLTTLAFTTITLTSIVAIVSTLLLAYNFISLLSFLNAASRVTIRLSLITWPLWTRPSKYFIKIVRVHMVTYWICQCSTPTPTPGSQILWAICFSSLAPWLQP